MNNHRGHRVHRENFVLGMLYVEQSSLCVLSGLCGEIDKEAKND
jgi:hypothetical protein